MERNQPGKRRAEAACVIFLLTVTSRGFHTERMLLFKHEIKEFVRAHGKPT